MLTSSRTSDGAVAEPVGPDLPLTGVKVLDLSTLLPGPMATMFLAQAGADVVKLERPGRGDEMRSYEPKFGEASANYAVLNRGKSAYAVDLKDLAQLDRVLDLVREADIVVEQFRPGVAHRLGIGYEAMSEVNRRLVYCSISGYGPGTPKAGHDLNFLAESGLLGTVVDPGGSPSLPVSVIADLAAGTYPALVNILLALRQVERTGAGCHLEVSMAHNLQLLAYGYFSTRQAGGSWPRPGGELLTGGSPRYQIYATADGRHIACAALEDRFWGRLVDVLGLDPAWRDDRGREQKAIAAVREAFAAHDSGHWRRVLDGEDVCTSLVATWDEAVDAGLVDLDAPERVCTPGGPDQSFATLPSVLDPSVRAAGGTLPYPSLRPLPADSPWA